MTWKNNLAQGFALFDTAASAMQACSIIAGVPFDEHSTLRCEMARKNMFTKEEPFPGPQKRARFGAGAPGTGNNTFSIITVRHFDQSPHAAAAASGPGCKAWCGQYGPAHTSPPSDCCTLAKPCRCMLTVAPTFSAPQAEDGQPMVPVQPTGFAPVTNLGDNPPCSTLFVGNLGDNISEQELRGLFGTQPGFKQLKVSARGARAGHHAWHAAASRASRTLLDE